MQRKNPNKEIIDQLETDSLETVRRTMGTLNETRQVAAATLEALYQQGEQLKSGQSGVDTVLYKEEVAERKLAGLSGFFGTISNWFKPAPVARDHLDVVPDAEPTIARAHKKTSVKTLFASDGDSVKKRETDQMLDEISVYLTDLEGMGAALQREVDVQNKRLQVLHKTTDEARAKMKVQAREAGRLAGK